MAFTYDASKIATDAVSRMRLELGDVPIGADGSAALHDEEIQLAIDTHKDNWLKAKIMLVEFLVMRYSYEVDTSIDGASWSLNQRYERWKSMLDQLKKQASFANLNVGLIRRNGGDGGHYFYKDMHRNPERSD